MRLLRVLKCDQSFNGLHDSFARRRGIIRRFCAPEAWHRALGRLNEPQSLTRVADLGALLCPTLFVVGAEDPIVPVSAMHDLAAVVPGSEVVVIEHAAHSAYFEQPAEFNRHVLHFLQRRVAGLTDLYPPRAP